MYASQSLLVLLACFSSALTATSTPTQVQTTATASAPVTFTTDAQGDIAFNISESLANSVSTHFNDTCPAGAGQKRLRKRVLDDHDVQCITNSAQYALKYAASSGNDLQNTLLLFPTDFPSLRGPLVASINQLAKFIQNPPLFNPSVFSGGLIHAILAVFVGIAFTLWVNGPGTGITQNMIPYSDLENAASSASSGCPSLTFSWTSPTLSTTVVPGTCDDTESGCPCSPVNTALAYEGTDPDIWGADLVQYNMVLDSPVCWPNTQALAGPTSTFCVCAGTSIEPAFYATISGASGESVCAYSASSDLPSIQYAPVTVPASVTTTSKTTSCSPTTTAFVETFYSPFVSTTTVTIVDCSCNGKIIDVTSWTLNGQPTTQCATGQTAPTPTITSAPIPAWNVGFYTANFAGPCYGNQVITQPGYPLSGDAAQTCTNMPWASSEPYPIGFYVSFTDGNWCATVSDNPCSTTSDNNVLTFCGSGAGCSFLGGGYGWHAYEVHPNTLSTTVGVFTTST